MLQYDDIYYKIVTNEDFGRFLNKKKPKELFAVICEKCKFFCFKPLFVRNWTIFQPSHRLKSTLIALYYYTQNPKPRQG